MRPRKHHLYKQNPKRDMLVGLPVAMRRLSVVSLCGSTRILQQRPNSVEDLVRAYKAGELRHSGSRACASCFAILDGYAKASVTPGADRHRRTRSPGKRDALQQPNPPLSTQSRTQRPLDRPAGSNALGAAAAGETVTKALASHYARQLTHTDVPCFVPDSFRHSDETEKPCPCGLWEGQTSHATLLERLG
jgi:hypothetical protein